MFSMLDEYYLYWRLTKASGVVRVQKISGKFSKTFCGKSGWGNFELFQIRNVNETYYVTYSKVYYR